MNAEQSIKAGNLEVALAELTDAVRNDPSRAEYRTFLFQLLCVMGNWNRALTQLNVVADMDPATLLMAQTYRELLLCEAFRQEVFEGARAPLLFGEPNDWLGTLVQALQPTAQGQGRQARELIANATDKAKVTSGSIDGRPFEWLADADMRLGPVFEIVLNGKYYWVPTESIAEITFSAPEDLRDLVWLPVQIKWINEGNAVGFMPSRYPGAATLEASQTCLARNTYWSDIGGECFIGAGQRMFATDSGDYPLLETRKIVFNSLGQTDDAGR